MDPKGVPIAPGLSIPLRELEFRFSRSGGPGGQNVNTRDTRVELIFDLAGSPSLGPRPRGRAMERLASRLDRQGRLRIVVAEERSQAQNREAAVARFRELLIVPRPRIVDPRPQAEAELRRELEPLRQALAATADRKERRRLRREIRRRNREALHRLGIPAQW